MRVIGITGGVGAGKSTVLSMLKELCDCQIIMADDVAKDMMKQDGPLCQDAVRLFGEESYLADGTLNTKHIAAMMYADPALRLQWEQIVHPAVNERIRTFLQEAYDFTFIEAALLIENHYEKICDEIWYVYADEETRTKRLIADRGYGVEKIKAIFNSQMKESEFRRHCQFVIDTGVSLAATRKQLENKLEQYNVI